MKLIKLFITLMFFANVQLCHSQVSSGYVKLKTNVILKRGDYPSSGIICHISSGEFVKVRRKASNGYYRVDYRNYSGFIHHLFLKNLNSTNSSNQYVNYTSSQNLNKEKKKGYVKLVVDGKLKTKSEAVSDIICLIPKGQMVLVKSLSSNGYYFVEYENYSGKKTGYLSSLYLPKDYSFNTINIKNSSNNYNYTSRKKKTIKKKKALPPIIKIASVFLSDEILEGGETIKLGVRIKNIGPGKADGVYMRLSCDNKNINVPRKKNFSKSIFSNNEGYFEIELKGNLDLNDGYANIDFEIIEPNFNIIVKGESLKFKTRSFLKPEFILAKVNLIEFQSANPNKQINLNEIVDLKLAIQNIGFGEAKNVQVDVENYQNGVMFMGYEKNDNLTTNNVKIPLIKSGDYEALNYRYFINSDFKDTSIKFTITISEIKGKFGQKIVRSFPINKKIEEVGYFRNITKNDNDRKKIELKLTKVPDFVIDVDTNIPRANLIKQNTYALIIGNEDYSSRQIGLNQEQNVDFAINDAQIFSIYCNKTLGIPNNQIKLLKNATYIEMKQGLEWLSRLAKVEKGNAELVFYYSGHGLPLETTREPYLIPVDVSASNIELGISLKEAYTKVTENVSKKVTVFLDACFSGGARNQGLIAMKGIKVKPQEGFIPGNMIVFSSSSNEESSQVYKEKQHGYFTYFLLKKLKETKGFISFKDLAEYINKEVSKATALKGKIQTPEVNSSIKVKDQWRKWNFNQ